MLKNFLKYISIPLFFILTILLYGLHKEHEYYTSITLDLSLMVVIPSIVFTFLFFIIPAKISEISLLFMGFAIFLKFLLFSVFFWKGLSNTPNEYIFDYVVMVFILLTTQKATLISFISKNKKSTS